MELLSQDHNIPRWFANPPCGVSKAIGRDCGNKIDLFGEGNKQTVSDCRSLAVSAFSGLYSGRGKMELSGSARIYNGLIISFPKQTPIGVGDNWRVLSLSSAGVAAVQNDDGAELRIGNSKEFFFLNSIKRNLRRTVCGAVCPNQVPLVKNVKRLFGKRSGFLFLMERRRFLKGGVTKQITLNLAYPLAEQTTYNLLG